MAASPQGCTPATYRRRRPADTPLYRAVQNHLETFLALCRNDWEDERILPHAERELRAYLECGILAYGFARVRCGECGHDFLVAFQCKPPTRRRIAALPAISGRCCWRATTRPSP